MAASWVKGNKLTLLNSGGHYFPALLQAIDSATREIHLESYIFANDPVGRQIASALVAAAHRGISVRVLVDGFGARNFAEDFLPELSAAGVQALIFRRELARFRLRRHRLRRLHRKLALIDGNIAFVGGINIVDDDNAAEDLRPRFDYAVRIEGPVVEDIRRAMRRLWEIVVWASLHRRYRIPRQSVPPPQAAGTQLAAFVQSDNLRHRGAIVAAYLEAIRKARQRILIANAYFLPGLRFRRALRAAARRGVQVTVLLQGRSDHPLLLRATRALYGALLAEGIRVVEYQRSFLHAKVAVIDGLWATVGSSNIDPFSLLLAKEANLLVRDPVFAATLEESLGEAMRDGGVEIHPGDYHRTGWPARLGSWLSYELVRLLVGLAGYGPRHWRADEERVE